ncbi:MAG: uroporphyrinogen-III C-methyltransferase, partial [Acidocella sp.]|nr:uroporphyrinogen-III C-methyltransferase [Acidocella sp.]
MNEVYLVGAGPGDPELLTVKAWRLLGRADAVLYDSLVDPRVVALARPGAKLIDVGKRCGKHALAQAQICRLLVAEAQAGGVVVRLKGGDPMVFGRATEEMEALRDAGIGFKIIPGVTAATAAAAALKLSLTKRGVARSLHFLTGHGAEDGLPAHDWVALTKSGGTIVVYMGGQTLGGLAAHLIEAGMEPDMPALAVENISLPAERVL